MLCENTFFFFVTEFLVSNGCHFENGFRFSEWFFWSQLDTNIEPTLYSTFDMTQVV